MSKKNSEMESSAFAQDYERLANRIRRQVFSAHRIDDAIGFAAVYGEVRRKNFDGCYSDIELERHIEERWRAANHTAFEDSANSPNTDCASPVMLLATELYDRGGHSQVVLTWLREMCEIEPHVLVLTEGLSDGCKRQLAELNVETIVLASSGQAAIAELLKIGARCRMLVLHIHPYDIVSAVAARMLREMGVPVVFYNHADHLFSFGIGAANLVCEISDYGEAINRVSKRTHGVRRRLGVPIDPPDLRKYAAIKLDQGLAAGARLSRIVSAGGAYKYSPDGKFELADFIDILISENESVVFVLVGPTGEEDWWASRKSKWGNRVVFRGLIPKEDYLKELACADIYIDSFPVTGGTAFPEALVAGLLCVGLATPIQGYSKADSLKAKCPAELAHVVRRLLLRDVKEIARIDKVRESVLHEQSPAAFRRALIEIYRSQTYQDCAQPLADVSADDRWIREKWHKEKKMYFPQRRLLARLPWVGYIKLFFMVQGLRAFISREDMRQIFLTFLTKLKVI